MCKANKSIYVSYKHFFHKCSINVILELFFMGLEIGIIMFNKKITISFQVLKLSQNFQTQDSLPTDIHSIGQLISDN